MLPPQGNVLCVSRPSSHVGGLYGCTWVDDVSTTSYVHVYYYYGYCYDYYYY